MKYNFLIKYQLNFNFIKGILFLTLHKRPRLDEKINNNKVKYTYYNVDSDLKYLASKSNQSFKLE